MGDEADSAAHPRNTAALQAALARALRERDAMATLADQRAHALDAVLHSTSWRLTAPLRRAVALLRDTLLQHREQPAPATPPTAAITTHAPATLPGHLWFYLGDTIEWLSSHDHATGVGRVTAALFHAAQAGAAQAGAAQAGAAQAGAAHADAAAPVTPCMIGPGGTLAPIDRNAAAAFLTARLGGQRSLAPPPTPQPGPGPAPGDSVMFTGLVWTPEHRALFQALVRRGVHVCVLVYDIIPLEQPHFVSPAHATMFDAWLRDVLGLATVVFVPGAGIAGQIARWAALAAVPVAAAIVPVAFGTDPPASAAPLPPSVRPSGFVLSVGTIDQRKNQAMLVRIWRTLITEYGAGREPGAVPQLVLVGRCDIDLHQPTDPLFQRGDVLVLEDADDATLAGLYAGCMLTVFPSLAEGYGLPVAESLAHGRLCLSSDLPPICEHAGNLVWYFPPGDEAAAAALIRHALDNAAERHAAEALIAARPSPPGWGTPWRHMTATVGALATGLAAPPTVAAPPALAAGLPPIDMQAAMANAAQWCTHTAPDVSILIVNWNAAATTLECLRHVWAHTTGRRYEVIIVDNGSGGADLLALQALGPGVRLIPLGINRYFGEANNIAAEMARGRYLCFLNNDAFATPAWLQPLADTLDNDATAGAAGPLFLFPNGLIQEAGGSIGPDGIPIRAGRGETLDAVAADVLAARTVDYISAAALLVRRDAFMAAGGFDLVYEPAYYEDVDLCFRLRAMGQAVRFCPNSRIVHVEGSAADADTTALDRRNALGNRNRATFMARWGNGAPPAFRTTPAFRPTPAAPSPAETRPRAVLFTPYPLSTGGGERYLLSLAAALASDHAVAIGTPHPYSTLRLGNLGRELGLDVTGCTLATITDLADMPADLAVVLGNHILPPIAARSGNTSYVCQFPFPMPPETIASDLATIGPYRRVIVYSEYARAHVLAGLSAHRMPAWPVEVLHPAVPRQPGDPAHKRRMILSVGRFFAGGHSKRHDLMIAAFRTLRDQLADHAIELHLAGAAMPGAEHQDHLTALRALAADLPVHFHVNAAPAALAQLYADAAIYWHAAGMGARLHDVPQDAEHFGISLVEAMSAGCATLAFNAGGPREIITSGVDGVLYGDEAELVGQTATLLGDDGARMAIGRAGMQRAQAFSADRFAHQARRILLGE